MHYGFHCGTTGESCVKEESDGRGGHVLGAEENQGELQGIQREYGGVLTPLPHRENTRDSPATDPGGRCRRKGGQRHTWCLFWGTEVGGMPGRQMPDKDEQPRKT